MNEVTFEQMKQARCAAHEMRGCHLPTLPGGQTGGVVAGHFPIVQVALA